MHNRAMSSAPIATSAGRLDVQVTSVVCVAHALSHFFQLLTTPLLPLMRAEFGLSFASLGTMMTATYVVSSCLQTPAGFAVDRFGPRIVLVFGLLMMSIGTLVLALAPSYPWLLVGGAIIGVGNSTFHPADLALLSAKVSPARLGYAFSAHSIAGNLGWVVAPIFAAAIASQWGWRYTLAAGTGIGIVFVAYLATQRGLETPPGPTTESARQPAGGAPQARVLLQGQVLMCLLFFFLTSMAYSSYMSFGPTALINLYGIPLVLASGVLTAFLIGGTAGTVAGGIVAARSVRHDAVTAMGVASAALFSMVVMTGSLPPSMLTVAAFLVGFSIGVTNPSRDILVRESAPPEARGRVYGFVYSGLDAGGALAPLLLGWFLDTDRPAWVFGMAAVLFAACIPTAYQLQRRRIFA